MVRLVDANGCALGNALDKAQGCVLGKDEGKVEGQAKDFALGVGSPGHAGSRVILSRCRRSRIPAARPYPKIR